MDAVRDASGNSVLLDQNLLEYETSPLTVREHDKYDLSVALFNDTLFLGNLHVMDYSLLVGMDKESGELVVGIIDYIRRYTWDKNLETWVKKSGLLGGGIGKDPTIISPGQYKKRFRASMARYFMMVPGPWTSSGS